MSAPSHSPATVDAARYQTVRAFTDELASPLSPEDACVQSMPDASPAKWHLAHTTWFFETFVLAGAVADFRPFHPQFGYLFNSYYESVGRMHPRPQRGLLTRPSLAEVKAYRTHVDGYMTELLATGRLTAEQLAVVEVGLHHEQQHQELLLTDIKHGFSCNPLAPEYRTGAAVAAMAEAPPLRMLDHDGGVVQIGHDGSGFSFDNERPRHDALVHPFSLASRLVTCGEFMAFMADEGYARPELWLSAGFDTVRTQGWKAPLYWQWKDNHWRQFTLHGMRVVDPATPVTHVSLYEADAYARWKGMRLPTEFEWELAAAPLPVEGNFVETGALHPVAATSSTGPTQAFGDAWEWTGSAYAPYPGFAPLSGALGEYNGKFMCNQLVLRGGSCATPRSHARATYRNFFPPDARWQFSGIRLAKDR